MDTVHAEIEDEFDLLDTEGHPLKKALAVVLGLAGLAGLALLIAYFDFLRHWTAIDSGTIYSPNSPVYYNFWSGFGSDLGEATLIGAVAWASIPGCARSTVIRRAVGGLAITR